MSGARPENPDLPPVGGGMESAVAALQAARQRARRVLVLEQVGVRLCPALSVLAVYGIAGLERLPQRLPDWLHLGVEAGTFGLALWLARRGMAGYEAPSLEGVDRRIEQASGLKHRPLASLTDRQAGDGSTALWQVFQSRLVASLGPLRAGWPRAAFDRRDPWRLAQVLPVLLLAAALQAGTYGPGRLAAALVPGWDDPDVPLPHVEAWITPPSYAPAAPVFLGSGQPVSPVPQGAVLTATVTGLHGGQPDLTESGLRDEKSQELDKQSWRLEATLETSGQVTLRARGRTIANWNIPVRPDAAPMVAWGKDPGGQKGSVRTRLPFEAHHAYGLQTLVAEIRLAHPPLLAPRRVLRVPIPLSGHPLDAKTVAMPDLSEDPWAGEEVTAILVATSVSKQEGRSTPVTFTLGSRTFRSPVARAVLDLRRRLALQGESRRTAASDLAALGETPGPIEENTGMFLNLTAIVSLLEDSDVSDDQARDEAVGRLWDLALDIEDRLHGGAEGALASIDVRAAQAAVAEQLKHMREDNAHGPEDQAELRRRMDTLRQAISRKMQALADQAMKDHTAIPDLPGLSRSGDRAFQRLMQRLQEDAAEGRGEGAMERLQQLEDSIEKMRNATPQDMANLAQQLVAQQKLKEQVEGLHDLVRQQTSLLDHSQSRVDRVQHAEERRQRQNSAGQEDGDEDFSTMSTQELLRRLGLTPPSGSMEDGGQSPQPQSSPNDSPQVGATPQGTDGQQEQAQQQLDGTAVPPSAGPGSGERDARQKEQRQADRAMQNALFRATQELQQEFKGLSGKEPPAFAKAQAAMKDARHALAGGNDAEAASAQKKALAALQDGQKQMRESLKGSGGSSSPSSFLPSFGSGQGGGENGDGADQAGDDGDEGNGGQSDENRSADRDPLGRATGEGNDQTSNGGGHIPDGASRERAHEIEEELRRRDSDRTRSPQELEYLDRLLKSF